MINALRGVWSLGVEGAHFGLRRQVALCNQVGLFCVLATLPYQLFYALSDFSRYRGVFLSNLLFIGIYFSVLALNYRRWHTAASSVLLTNGACQLFVVTAFIGFEAGVSLFYFMFASMFVFLFSHVRVWLYCLVMVGFGGLFLTTYFLFPAAAVSAPVLHPWQDIMFMFSVVGVLALAGALLYWLRQRIDRTEDELMLSNQHLEGLSNTDSLTGLANRRVLDATLEREWARLGCRSGALSIIMFDVDHFKRFNDHYGHDGGDRCLQQISAAARRVVLGRLDLLVRYGGEEFAVVLPGTAEAGAVGVGHALCKAVERLAIPNALVGNDACVTISVGVSSIDHISRDLRHIGFSDLMKCADEALYEAKANGRNQVVFKPYVSPLF